MMQLRRSQQKVMAYTGGYMAVSAVPGSGKTTTLSLLAVELIERHGFGRLEERSLRQRLQQERTRSANEPAAGQELELPQVLIVTFSNAAVANFKSKIAGFLRERGLPQHAGYDVRTLHSLSHWIVQQAPGDVGLDPEYDILGEVEFHRGVASAVARFISHNRTAILEALGLSEEVSESDLRRVMQDLATTTIRTAKMMRLRPEELMRRLAGVSDGPVVRLAMLGAEMYAEYQQYLNQRASLDFDDLVWLAYDLLQKNRALLRRLQQRWPYILEDEAQDSSPLQEKILALLSAAHHNWVRVGDPNQAINATFTSADPRYFRRFCERPDVRLVRLDEAGRSALPIIRLANDLVKWTCEKHPEPEIRRRAFALQMIHPVPKGDPQPNPPAEESTVHLTREFPTWEAEVREICQRAKRYVQTHPNDTVAILVPTNILGSQVVKQLSELGVDFEDLLREPSQARSVLRVLAGIAHFATAPRTSSILVELFSTLAEAHVWELPAGLNISRLLALLRSARPERLLFPEPGKSRRMALPPVEDLPEELIAVIERFAEQAAGWLRASLLPIDEFVLTVGTELFRSPFQLALVQQIAAAMRRAADMNPSWRLPDLARELAELSSDPRALPQMGFRELGYTPQPGVINVATLHGAKGLEWDLVYILGADRAWFPEHPDQVWMESWGILEGSEREEVTELIRALSDEVDLPRGAHPPTKEAQLEHIAERLRLLYVGITRARRRLCISWSRRRLVSGPFGILRDKETDIAPALERLRQFYERAAKGAPISEAEP